MCVWSGSRAERETTRAGDLALEGKWGGGMARGRGLAPRPGPGFWCSWCRIEFVLVLVDFLSPLVRVVFAGCKVSCIVVCVCVQVCVW